MTGEVDAALARAREQQARGDAEGAAATLDAVAALDRARVLPPLQEVLDGLAVQEHGLTFRYVPAGTFLMGSDRGEPDEAPEHPVTLPGFWMAEAPLSWADFARVLGWPAPPALPSGEQLAPLAAAFGERRAAFAYNNDSRMRLRYCDDAAPGADGPAGRWPGGGTVAGAPGAPGGPARAEEGPPRFSTKPMVAVGWELAAEVGRRMSTGAVRYRLPSEAEWERAARGCFRAASYPWGDAPPMAERADFGRFGRFSLLPSRTFPPNDYGLYAMAGGVWEWCQDHYDADFYRPDAAHAPLCTLPPTVPERQHVLRGGSWADCADVLRVSFRFASLHGRAPNIGFRLVRERGGSPR